MDEPIARIGFSGTRKGMTAEQLVAVAVMVGGLQPRAVYHGCCLGADEDFADIVNEQSPSTLQFGHPSTLRGLVSVRACRLCNSVVAPRPPLERNRDIVDATRMLLATPAGMVEEIRSGTWATIRYARRLSRPIMIVWPDGTVKVEPGAADG